MNKNKYRRETLYKVIVVYLDHQGKAAFAKYRNILCDRPASWSRSKKFFKSKFPTATHVNIYGGLTGQFKRQEKFDG
jgi:hypothetical protein